MPSWSADRNPVEQLAEEFAERLRRGETPSLSEYVHRYPEYADEIREVFPALVLMEQLKPGRGDHPGEDGKAGASSTSAEAQPGLPAEAVGAGCRLGRLGDYLLVRELGRGGMGVVYEAEQMSLGRHVALKVLPPAALLNPTFRERFRREARAGAGLHHTNIVPVFGVGESDGVPFYAMQFIQGEGLDRVLHDLQRLRRTGQVTPLPAAPASVAQSLLTGGFAAAVEPPVEGTAPGESETATLTGSNAEGGYYRSVAQLGLQVAEALAYAHRHGVLHRDIKPSNLLLDHQGTVWVTDFGLAKAEGSDELTHTGDVVGTLRFMAPERFQGRSLPQSDVYALGATLYEMLTLKPAFEDGDRARLIQRVLHETPATPREVEPHVPRDLETVVLKCLARDPGERYPGAEALAEDLRRFLADRPILARRSTWQERTWRWCRRNPAVSTLVAAVLVLLAVTALGGVTMSLSLHDALGRAQGDRDQAQQAEQKRKRQLFESLVSEAKAHRFSGRVGQRFDTLASIQKAAGLARELGLPPSALDELRDLAIAALALPDFHLLRDWEGYPKGTRAIVFDDTLERYARLDDRGTLTVCRVADDVEIARREGVKPTVALGNFQEAGHALVLLDRAEQSQELWRFDGGQTAVLSPLPGPSAPGIARIDTADQTLVVTADQKAAQVSVYESASGKHLRDIPFGDWPVGPRTVAKRFLCDMHPWRHELAIGTYGIGTEEDRRIRVLDLDRGTVLAELTAEPDLRQVIMLAWHADGRTLAAGYWWGVLLWDVPSGKPVGPAMDHKGGWGAFGTAISRSGQLMSTWPTWGGGVKFWHPYTRKLLLSLPGMNPQAMTPTADGRMYVQERQDTRLRLWTTEPSPVLRVLVRNPIRGAVRQYRRCSVRHDGRLLAVGSSEGVSLFDLANGLDVGHLDVGSTLSVEFDPVTGDLFTLGICGLLRWPVRAEPGGVDGLRVGPPTSLLGTPQPDCYDFHISPAGRTIVVSKEYSALVLPADHSGPPVKLSPTQGLRQQVSISSDGQWVVTGCHGDGQADPYGSDVRVWEARTGRLVKSQHFTTAGCLGQFTPDGARLLVGTLDRCRFWRTGDWEELPPVIEGGSDAGWSGTGPLPVFTPPDGRLLAWESGAGALRLLDTTTGRTIARLECREQGLCGYTAFSPDGRLLVTTDKDETAVHVWDLHKLRRLLRDMDLDWEAPREPAAQDQPAQYVRPMEVAVDCGGMTGVAEQRLTAKKENEQAWRLVTGPPEKRDWGRALELSELSIRHNPDVPRYLKALGVAQYRNGRYQQALSSLEKCLNEDPDYDESDTTARFFLAASQARLGNLTQARRNFDLAGEWINARRPGLPLRELEQLESERAEVEALLHEK